MIVKGWHNYSLKSKKSVTKDKEYNPFDSLNDSCASDVNEAGFERIAPEKRVAIRRGGLLEGKLLQKCEFQPAVQICGAYEDGKKTKHKVSRNSKISHSKRASKTRSKDVHFTAKSNKSNGRALHTQEDEEYP